LIIRSQASYWFGQVTLITEPISMQCGQVKWTPPYQDCGMLPQYEWSTSMKGVDSLLKISQRHGPPTVLLFVSFVPGSWELAEARRSDVDAPPPKLTENPTGHDDCGDAVGSAAWMDGMGALVKSGAGGAGVAKGTFS